MEEIKKFDIHKKPIKMRWYLAPLLFLVTPFSMLSYKKKIEKVGFKKIKGGCLILSNHQSFEDFKFLENLPGKKILLKGNHDLWWSTVKKIRTFWEENDLKSFKQYLEAHRYQKEDSDSLGNAMNGIHYAYDFTINIFRIY